MKKIYQDKQEKNCKRWNLWKLLLYKQVKREINCEGLYPIKIRKRKCLTWKNFFLFFLTHNFDISLPPLVFDCIRETSLPSHGEKYRWEKVSWIQMKQKLLNDYTMWSFFFPFAFPHTLPTYTLQRRFIHSCAVQY